MKTLKQVKREILISKEYRDFVNNPTKDNETNLQIFILEKFGTITEGISWIDIPEYNNLVASIEIDCSGNTKASIFNYEEVDTFIQSQGENAIEPIYVINIPFKYGKRQKETEFSEKSLQKAISEKIEKVTSERKLTKKELGLIDFISQFKIEKTALEIIPC